MRKFALYGTLLASVCQFPAAAMAQDNSFDISAAPPAQSQAAAPTPSTTSLNEITLGAQWLGGSNTGQYGRYNGFTTQGLDSLGGFNFQNRDPWDSGDTFYYNFNGINLDIQTGKHLTKNFTDSTYTNSISNDLGPTAELSASFGQQGTWGVTADYDAISYTGNIINSIYTVNGTNGTLNNNFAAWGGATNSPSHVGTTTAFTTTTLTPAEQAFQVGTRRDIFQVVGEYLFDDWTLTTDVRHEQKTGTMEESLRETYGGQAFTMPIDYDTDRFDISASYILPDFQAVLAYSYSHFTDNNLAVSLPYPVSIASLSSTSGPYAQTGLYSLPPSNSAHYVTARLSDKELPSTQIVLNARVGVELQNSTFPANSADPNLSSSLGSPQYSWFSNLNSMNQGTSATSPNDVAWVYQGKLAVNTDLATDLEGQLSYSFDGRSVSLNQYKVYNGGASPDATATTAVYVVPQGWFNQTANIEAVYNILKDSNTKLVADYSFNNINRSNAQVEHSITNTESVQLSSMIGTDVMARLSYEHSERNGILIYGTAWGNLESGTPEIYDTPSGAYYQAPMVSDTVILRGDYAPIGDLSGSLFLKYVNEDYHYPAVPNTAPTGDWTLTGYGEGITRDYNLSVGPDVGYRPDPHWDMHIYYTYELIFFNNLGNGACAESNTGVCAGSAGYFQNIYKSGTNTAGLSAQWQATDKLKLGTDYNMQYGVISFGEFNGVEVPSASVTQTYQNVAPYPSINSTMNDVRLTAIYQLASQVEWALKFQYSMLSKNDWNDLAASVQPTTNTGTAISILTPGYASPQYNVYSIGSTFRVKF